MQAEPYIAELKRILGAITIVSPECFRFAGREFRAERKPLVGELEDCIYRHCYTTAFDGSLPEDSSGSADVTRGLQAAHIGRACRDAGWRIEEVGPSGQILASKNGAARRFLPGQYLTNNAPGRSPEPGGRVIISFGKESTELQAGFYFIFGETVNDYEEDQDLIRFYWNISEAGAAALVRSITGNLNRFQVPFQFKCTCRRELFYRRDAAVLYVHKKYYQITAMLAAEVHRSVLPFLRPETPLFTKGLALGLGLAENPVRGDSFGATRCRILAESICAAHKKRLETEEARFKELSRQFRKRRLDLERPYLNPGSSDCYEWPG